ncbi:unnamed protein product [Parajaminaea phylloscopi]
MAFSSKNAFALLGDEDSSAPVAPAKAAAPAAAPAAAAAAAPSRNIPGSGRGAPRGAQRGAPRGAKGTDGPAVNSDDAPQSREIREPRRGRGDGRGRGRGRGGRGRAFDRHSATDRVDSEKQVSQAWGGDDGKRELKAEEDGVADADAENKPATNGQSTPAAAGEWDEAAPAAAAPVEEVDNTKTLDEYLADLAAKKATLGGKGAAPRTVEADAKWDNFGNKVVKTMDGSDEYFAASKTGGAARQRERKEKQLLEIEQQFNTPPVQQRGGRGGARGGRGESGRGRGEGRGRGGRGGARGARGAGSANVNLDDKRAFPTLS